MSTTRINFRNFICIIVMFTTASLSSGETITLEDLSLEPESYFNGSDDSGGFVSSFATFSNNYDPNWASWDGFSYSNITDTTSAGLAGQYNAITGTGQGNSANYAVCNIGWTEPPTITLKTPCIVDGLYVTNCNYAYYSMLNGDMFAKKFGGDSGNEPDWLLLTVTGKDNDGIVTGSADYYLADFRFEDNNQDYILNTWEYIDLTDLGIVKTLEFSLSSSDTSDWGMNTPSYFALDSIEYQPVSIYTAPYTESGINGYINPDNKQPVSPDDPGAIINPIFKGWATEVVSYSQSPGVDPQWSDPNKVLGPATGRFDDIFSLGDLSREQIDEGIPPGQITVTFDEPIRNVNGYDFAVFENALITDSTSNDDAVHIMAELAFVEVSSNGEDFVRFPAVSLTDEEVGLFGTIDMNKIHNLAGKHPNAYGICMGTPFDLDDIANEPDVISGLVDINDIQFVRIVDIPGTGDFYDNAVSQINPNTWPDWDYYSDNHPIFDAWNTSLVPLHPSGGFDLEAVGVLHEQQLSADIDLNGIVDEFDLVLFESALDTRFGQPNWLARCDLAEPKDMIINDADLEILIDQWLEEEIWRD